MKKPFSLWSRSMSQVFSSAPWGVGVRPLLITAACAASLTFGGFAAADGYEPDVVPMQAKNLLPKEVLKGDNYEIVDAVTNRGYMNNYKIKSDFGEFAAMNDTEALMRTHEIKAIAKLKDMSTTGVVADAVVDTTANTVTAVSRAAQNPEETVRGIPDGVGRLFKRAKRTTQDVYEKATADSDGKQGSGESAAETTEEVVESVAKQYLGVNSAYRKLAKELKVDPYTDNTVLRAELERVSKVAGAASFGTNLLVPLPGVVKLTKNVSDLVWNMSPTDLLLQNEKQLAEMGADQKLIKVLFTNPSYTPAVLTVVVSALQKLGPVPGRLVIVRRAAEVETKQEAYFYTRMAELLALYHSTRNPIVRIEDTDRIPLGVAKDGAVLALTPLDYLSWSENTAQAARYLNGIVTERKLGNPTTVWVEGRVSSRAKSELAKLGWQISDRAFDKLGG